MPCLWGRCPSTLPGDSVSRDPLPHRFRQCRSPSRRTLPLCIPHLGGCLPDKARNRFLAIRISDAERSIIDERLALSHLSLQEYTLRRLLRDGEGSSQMSYADLYEFAKGVTCEIKKCGVNINQLTKAHNSGRQVDERDILGAVTWLTSSLLHLVPREQLLQIVRETAPCPLKDEVV